MADYVVIDEREITITPVFKYVQLENVAKSETQGYAVMEMHEVVEVRFAGQKLFSPVFPVHERWQRIDGRDVSYAERWGEQYRAFKAGEPQEALGAPLEMLRQYGVTPEQVALCRALKIYSVEALHHLEGPNLKSLGMHQNKLKDAARQFMAQRTGSADMLAQMEALQARIAELEGQGGNPVVATGTTPVPEKEASEQEIDDALQRADDAYAGMTDVQIKDEIERISGTRPRGNPGRPTLVAALDELKAAA